MKLLLEIKGIFNQGVGYKKITHEIEVEPKFKLKKTKISSLKVPSDMKEYLNEEYGSYLTTSRKEQYDDYLSNDSNGHIRNLMDDLDIAAIENWKILRVGEARKKKTNTKIRKTKADKNRSKVHELIINLKDSGHISDSFSNEVVAFYTEMYESIKHLSPYEQFKISLSALGAGTKAATEAYRHITQYSRDLDDELKKERKELSNNGEDEE